MQTSLMSNTTPKKRTLLVSAVAAIALIAGMAMDTKIIKNGSAEDLRKQAFSPDRFAQSEYPKIKDFVLSKAVSATTLFDALQTDSKAATTKYGVKSGIGSIVPVSFEGTVKSGRSGVFTITINGLPDSQTVRVQTGPAINGTALRDATGNLKFGQFKNQIEYQDVGSALNRAMKSATLDSLDRSTLVGKTVQVTGVFRLLNPKNWLVTPVRFDVK